MVEEQGERNGISILTGVPREHVAASTRKRNIVIGGRPTLRNVNTNIPLLYNQNVVAWATK